MHQFLKKYAGTPGKTQALTVDPLHLALTVFVEFFRRARD